MKRKVLWVEDGALVHLAELAGPVYRAGEYDLVVALNVTDAVEHILRAEFDVLIVDIRIPPGEGNEWIELYVKRERGLDPRLGIEFLKTILGNDEARVKLPSRPDWLNASRIAVLTVENYHEIQKDIGGLGITRFREKTTSMPRRVLVDLIEDVLMP